MKRIIQGWIGAGLAFQGLVLAEIAGGRVHAQSVAEAATPSPQSAPAIVGSPFPGGYSSRPRAAGAARPVQPSGQAPTSTAVPYPQRGAMFPAAPSSTMTKAAQGLRAPASPLNRATPYPDGDRSPGFTPGASPQAAAGIAGYPRTSAAFPIGPTLGPGTPFPSSTPSAEPGLAGPSTPGSASPGAGSPGAGTGTGTGAGYSAAIDSTGGLDSGGGPETPAPTNIASLGTQSGQAEDPGFTPNMLGDLSPYYAHSALSPAPPLPPGPHGLALLYPTVRNFKMSENQSPRPMDRVFFDYNYYTNLNSTVNTAQRSPINRMNASVYVWGFEKTFDQGNGSIGIRLPLNSLSATSFASGVAAPTSSSLGNLDIFAKYILKQNRATGSLISAGLDLTPSSGPGRFAGAPYLNSLNTTYFQPFLAYIWRMDRVYIQGFNGFDFPTNNADVSLMYNDIGIGYFVYRTNDRTRAITAIAPTFEVHVNSPLNHRNPYNIYDPAASAYDCNLTYGLNVLFGGKSMLTAALVTPVSTPKPFDAEFALMFNYFFGRTARQITQITPPAI